MKPTHLAMPTDLPCMPQVFTCSSPDQPTCLRPQHRAELSQHSYRCKDACQKKIIRPGKCPVSSGGIPKRRFPSTSTSIHRSLPHRYPTCYPTIMTGQQQTGWDQRHALQHVLYEENKPKPPAGIQLRGRMAGRNEQVRQTRES